jgi:hypothetical protein
MEPREELYLQAKDRIAEMNFTADQVDFIFDDHGGWLDYEEGLDDPTATQLERNGWDVHITWLLTAPREEIQTWIDDNK